ncbi:MAG: hypothetical protein HON94_10610 [Methylococcales bacterium]|nr:hypothetical protein [Methylococcales bacterium]MBT7409916.1 hypothetical protein [Methylococcales bacterium]
MPKSHYFLRKHRLVYKVTKETISIAQCRYYY